MAVEDVFQDISKLPNDWKFKTVMGFHFPFLKPNGDLSGYPPHPDMISEDGKIVVELGKVEGATVSAREIPREAIERVDKLFNKYDDVEEVWLVPFPEGFSLVVFRFKRNIEPQVEMLKAEHSRLVDHISKLRNEKNDRVETPPVEGYIWLLTGIDSHL